MSDIHALSGAYAVDALDEAERTQFELHLETCPECRAEVRSFVETTALITEASSEVPPESLRSGVLSAIGTVRPLPPEGPEATPDRAGQDPHDAPPARHISTAPRLARRWFPATVAAAVAVILLAAGALVWQPWQSGGGQASLADQVMHAPDAVKVTEPVPGGGQLTVWRSASLKRAVMVGDHVAEPKPGTVYQLWLLQPGGRAVSAGLMPDSTQPALLSGDAATATAAAITVEPDTGSPQPTSKPIATFPFRSST
jgi:anti-sigma-K factor RskA